MYKGETTKELALFKNKQHEINYLYFSFFLFTILLMSLPYFFRQENFFLSAPFFFALYTLGQAFMEVCGLVFIACLLKEKTHPWIFQIFIGLSFMVLLAYYVDFNLLRLMDTSFSYLLSFFFGSGFDHLCTAFLTLNMNQIMVGLIFCSVFAIPVLGMVFYAWTYSWVKKKPCRLSLKQLGAVFCASGACLFLLDVAASCKFDRPTYYQYEKALPLGKVFFAPQSKYCVLQEMLPKLRPEREISQRIDTVKASTVSLPNIYFFIIETLRKDFITPDIAPIFSQFVKDNISFAETFANANYSNLSWYALLHGNYPLYWTHARDTYEEGGAPLRLLKKLGYKIRVYSSADLSYFHMQKTLFGKEGKLIDHLEQYTDLRNLKPCDRDALALEAFARDLEENKQGTLYLFFLDSTHSEYSFPKHFPLKFEPISDHISYLTISKSGKDLERLKNRYRNSIAYVDSLLGKWFSLLQEKGLYEDSILALTGDHAEEFFEEGSLFHGTHLNRYQTAVPIACKFQQNGWKERVDLQRHLMSHVDIFPSIIHYVTGSEDFADLFDGASIFTAQERPYHLSVLQNGVHPPTEFSLEWGEERIRAKLADRSTLEILSSSQPDSNFIAFHVLKALRQRRTTKDLWQKGE